MSSDQPKRIIIDEDWKSQVEREREQLRAQGPAAEGPVEAPSGAVNEGPQLPGPPEASMEMLVTVLATEALGALGQIPDPETGRGIVRLDWAKYHIDTLAVLEDKTRGNVTPGEAKLLHDALHELRMLYVAVGQQGPQQGPT